MEERREENLDLRQRKTRRQLTQALVELMEERPFQELSVTDICRRAMVHRTTFYAHFTDKQELLHYLLVQEATAVSTPASPGTPTPPAVSFWTPPAMPWTFSSPGGPCIGPASRAERTPRAACWRTPRPMNWPTA